MKEEDLKWYSPIVFLVGAILSFADPITDILTLVEFYRADHKTWFALGLTFVILPCLVFPVLYFLASEHKFSQYSGTRQCMQTVICGFHPFSAAFARLQGFFFCIKKWWRVDDIDSASTENADGLLNHIDIAVLFESVLESAPQFILQLYVMSVQEEPVEVIQMISLPISFLSLALASTTADEFLLRRKEVIDALKIKYKLALFVTQLFVLSSRLFAICFFTVSYKKRVVVVFALHSVVIATADNFWYEGEWDPGVRVASFFFYLPTLVKRWTFNTVKYRLFRHNKQGCTEENASAF